MYSLSNENEETKKEIDIRGRYLLMSCDIEFALFGIIIYCNPDPVNHERTEQFRKMHMYEKINNAIADLKKYKLPYYQEFKEWFDGLEEFRLVRNDMAHNKGNFPMSPDLSVFRITFVDKDPADGINKLMYRDYTETYIRESIDRFAKINGNLSALWIRMYKEHGGGIPPTAF